jgi:hypothetical protein
MALKAEGCNCLYLFPILNFLQQLCVHDYPCTMQMYASSKHTAIYVTISVLRYGENIYDII